MLNARTDLLMEQIEEKTALPALQQKIRVSSPSQEEHCQSTKN
jgi:hypothetical protein